MVTGGCRGIGRAIADALAAARAGVDVFDIDGPADGSAFPHRLANVDVSDTIAVARGVNELAADPTLLVNNAGITRDRSLAKMSRAEWTSVIDVNLTSAFNMIRAVGPRMLARGFGRIVNISSINRLRGKFG